VEGTGQELLPPVGERGYDRYGVHDTEVLVVFCEGDITRPGPVPDTNDHAKRLQIERRQSGPTGLLPQRRVPDFLP